MKKPIFLSLIAALVATTVTLGSAHEKVKLTGYVVDLACFAEHAKDKPEAANKIAAEHTRECALMDDCIKGGYGIYADGQWYPFDAKGNELAKAAFEKSRKKDHFKMTVEGMQHEGKILVAKVTEEQ